MNKTDCFISKLSEISLKDKNNIQQYFNEVADYLFHNIAIKAGEDNFTFLEIEFYYYKKGEIEGSLFNCTYPRIREVGQFFWHYSGIDICFKSTINEKEQTFGGILIRSLMKNNQEIIAGPMCCSNELMNCCNKELPILIDRETILENNPESTIRYGIEADKGQKEMKFCYYIKPDRWARTRNNVLVANKEGGYDIIKQKKYYYIAQPEKR